MISSPQKFFFRVLFFALGEINDFQGKVLKEWKHLPIEGQFFIPPKSSKIQKNLNYTLYTPEN